MKKQQKKRNKIKKEKTKGASRTGKAKRGRGWGTRGESEQVEDYMHFPYNFFFCSKFKFELIILIYSFRYLGHYPKFSLIIVHSSRRGRSLNHNNSKSSSLLIYLRNLREMRRVTLRNGC